MTRMSVLLWSALSGAMMGLIGGALLLGVATITASVFPVAPRLVERVRVPLVVLCLVAIPAVMAVLGWLEGQAKLD
ncbi:MAG: hypothetical protein ACYC3Q_02230 [Gemmatimonadaceae bacterium]